MIEIFMRTTIWSPKLIVNRGDYHRTEGGMRRSERKQADADLGVLAGRLLFAVQEELFRTLAEQGHPGLRPQHGAVLAYLDAEGSRATDLARHSGQHKQVIGKLLDELEAL